MDIYSAEELRDQEAERASLKEIGIDYDTHIIPEQDMRLIPSTAFFKRYIEDILCHKARTDDCVSFTNLENYIHSLDVSTKRHGVIYQNFKWIVFAICLEIATYADALAISRSSNPTTRRSFQRFQFFATLLRDFSQHALAAVIAFQVPELLHAAIQSRYHVVVSATDFEGMIKLGMSDFIVPLFRYVDKSALETHMYLANLWMLAVTNVDVVKKLNRVVPMAEHMDVIQWPILANRVMEEYLDNGKKEPVTTFLWYLERAITHQDWSLEKKAEFWGVYALEMILERSGFLYAFTRNLYDWQQAAYAKMTTRTLHALTRGSSLKAASAKGMAKTSTADATAASTTNVIAASTTDVIAASTTDAVAASASSSEARPDLSKGFKRIYLKQENEACLEEACVAEAQNITFSDDCGEALEERKIVRKRDDVLVVKTPRSELDTDVPVYSAIEYVGHEKVNRRFTVRQVDFHTRTPAGTRTCRMGIRWKDVDGFMVIDEFEPGSVFDEYLSKGDVLLRIAARDKTMQCLNGLSQGFESPQEMEDLFYSMCQYSEMFVIAVATYRYDADTPIEEIVEEIQSVFCDDRTSHMISLIGSSEGLMRSVQVYPATDKKDDIKWGFAKGKAFVRSIMAGSRMSKDFAKGDVLVQIQNDASSEPIVVSDECDSLVCVNGVWNGLWEQGTLPFKVLVVRSLSQARLYPFEDVIPARSKKLYPDMFATKPCIRRFEDCGDKYVEVQYTIEKGDIGVEVTRSNKVIKVSKRSMLRGIVHEGMTLRKVNIERLHDGDWRTLMRRSEDVYDEKLQQWWDDQSQYDGFRMTVCFEYVKDSGDDDDDDSVARDEEEDESSDDEDEREDLSFWRSTEFGNRYLNVRYTIREGKIGVKVTRSNKVVCVKKDSLLHGLVQEGMNLRDVNIERFHDGKWKALIPCSEDVFDEKLARWWDGQSQYNGFRMTARFKYATDKSDDRDSVGDDESVDMFEV